MLPSATYGNYAFLYDATLAPSGDCDFMTAAIATRNSGNMNASGISAPRLTRRLYRICGVSRYDFHFATIDTLNNDHVEQS